MHQDETSEMRGSVNVKINLQYVGGGGLLDG